MDRLEYSLGNTKVPFPIVNFCAARECPSRKLGMCQCADRCYADKAERVYPGCLPFRRRQEEWWRAASVKDVLAEAAAFEADRARRSKRNAKVLRFSESGDFQDQAMVDKFALFAMVLIAHGWTVYGYTARRDLDLTPLLTLGVRINRSFDTDNPNYVANTNRFRVVKEPTGDNFVCRGDCRLCAVCRNVTGKTVEVVAH